MTQPKIKLKSICIFCHQETKKELINKDIKKLANIMHKNKLNVPEFCLKVGLAKRTVYRWITRSNEADFKIKNIYWLLIKSKGLA